MRIFAFELVLHIEHQIGLMERALELSAGDKKKNVLKKEIVRLEKLFELVKRCPQYRKFETTETNTKRFIYSMGFQSELQTAVQAAMQARAKRGSKTLG